MKRRIKIDSFILSSVIILTGFLYMFPNLYIRDHLADNVLDFLGIIILIKGNLLRMVARGYKKRHSVKGESLVTTGPYHIVRNPMYLGSFLIGSGFVLIVWPWWTIFIFAGLFYLRFNKQITAEEEFLEKKFKDEYTKYCQKVPRLFPSVKNMIKTPIKDMINIKDANDTKERRGLWLCLLAAIAFEYLQESVVYGAANLKEIVAIFFIAIFFFVSVFIFFYTFQQDKKI